MLGPLGLFRCCVQSAAGNAGSTGTVVVCGGSCSVEARAVCSPWVAGFAGSGGVSGAPVDVGVWGCQQVVCRGQLEVVRDG